jgi:hypothetical protein
MMAGKVLLARRDELACSWCSLRDLTGDDPTASAIRVALRTPGV